MILTIVPEISLPSSLDLTSHKGPAMDNDFKVALIPKTNATPTQCKELGLAVVRWRNALPHDKAVAFILDRDAILDLFAGKPRRVGLYIVAVYDRKSLLEKLASLAELTEALEIDGQCWKPGA